MFAERFRPARVLALAIGLLAPGAALAQDEPVGRGHPPTDAEMAAIFASWEGNWDGTGRSINWESGELEDAQERLAVRRQGENVRLIYNAEPDQAVLLGYEEGFLVFGPGEETEGREEIVEFSPIDENGDWLIVTAYQITEEDNVFDLLQVYHMREGAYRHEIASRPALASGEDEAAPEQSPEEEAEALSQFQIEFQMEYTRAANQPR